ncbi:hypothetical protein T439DRAFT_326562 [Meredithblackwellia eburnea MCA 4105]
MAPSLLDFLCSNLQNLPGKHDFSLQVVRSQPRRSYALFPHSSIPKLKLWQQEVLVILKERPTNSTDIRVPVVALEANIYYIPHSSTSLVYVSKVDSSGLAFSSPSPAKSIASSFIAYHLQHPPHSATRVRVHVFARAQGQYLFPGSVENKQKRVLDDKGLLRWWKACFSQAADQTTPKLKEGKEDDKIQLFYLVPGLTYQESLPYVPDPPTTSTPKWHYGHPNNIISSPLHLPTFSPSQTPAPVTDHIPNFPDDPKARFITSLCSSAISPAGAPDDYDELIHSITSRSFNTGTNSQTALDDINKERMRERHRFLEGVKGGMDEWWERMQFRQECISGVLVGFFVGVRDGISSSSSSGEIPPLHQVPESADKVDRESTAPSISTNGKVVPVDQPSPKPERASIGYQFFTRLWSQFHNVDYALPQIEKCRIAADKWEKDVEMIVRGEGYDPVEDPSSKEKKVSEGEGEEAENESKRKRKIYEDDVFREILLDNPALPSKKRELDGSAGDGGAAPVAPKVNVMVPRKKVKK